MGDLFRREAAAAPEPFTGERLTSAIGGQVQIEHYHRYLFARALCRDLDILDVASGEGYGAAQLAQVARSVTGVEFDGDTVQAAARNFNRHNLNYRQGDARALPLPDDCVDAVVSFETIEHFDRQEAFLSEIRRVLRPGGILIVSTPDRDIYSGPNTQPNPYHVKELTAQEFLNVVHAQFPQVAMLRQRPLIGSALLADAGSDGPPLVFDRRGDTQFEACDGLPRAPYLIAVASDRPLPRLPSSLYIERSDLDTTSHALQDRSRTLDEARAGLVQARQAVEALQAREAALQADLNDTLTTLESERATLADLRSALETARSATAAAEDRATVALEQAAASDQARAVSAAEAAETARELHALRGSARTFLRHYLPRLRRHLLG